jgi:hypothetical protein
MKNPEPALAEGTEIMGAIDRQRRVIATTESLQGGDIRTIAAHGEQGFGHDQDTGSRIVAPNPP